MVQEYKRVGIVGAGASGCIAAYYLLNAGIDVTLFDYALPLRTLLPTGGGRCNLAHAEYDFKELAKNYPRGEKFLYSVFSQFSTYDTLALFEDLGISTYTQEDGRIFPCSNSAKNVREIILSNIKKASIILETVNNISKEETGLIVKTNKAKYHFDSVIVATGGGRTTRKINGINHKIIPLKPSLVGLNTNIKKLSGVVLKNVFSKDCNITGDILFTHFGLSGPLIFKISAIKAREDFPYNLTFDLVPQNFAFQEILNKYPHKEIKNILTEFLPKSFIEYLLEELNINSALTGCNINGKTRDKIVDFIHNFQITILSANKGDETVTCGGIDLNQINAKTMESKLTPNLFFLGEVLDIDGFCGGFNLQNAWSTAYVASQTIIQR